MNPVFNGSSENTERELLSKFRISIIGGKRYYEFDVGDTLPILDNCIPYFFRYGNIEIYESSWVHLTLKILEAIDSLSPKTDDYLLGLKYWWSKTEVFSREKRTNYSQFKDIFLNTNHTSTHALMNIQCLLKAYGIEPKDCFLLIRRHPIAEPQEVRNYIIEKTKEQFCIYLKLIGESEARISKIVRNVDVINKILRKVSGGFDNFYLFDDYNYFINYSEKIIARSEKIYAEKPNNVLLVKKYLGYLDTYFKYKSIMGDLPNETTIQALKDFIQEEIEQLFKTLDTETVTGSKLYSRMKIMHPEIMRNLGKINNAKDFYKLCNILLGKVYYFKEPFISKTYQSNLTQENMILAYAYSKNKITLREMNLYCDKMHLKHIPNYLDFIKSLSDEYVQIDKQTLVRKNIIGLDENVINSIKKELSFYIQSFGTIDSAAYNGYSSLPTLEYKWNKYLLVGIVRAFLNDTFAIKDNGKQYDKAEYKLSIKNN